MHLLHNPCREVGVNLPRQPLVSLPLTLLHHPPHTPLLEPLLGPLLPVEPLVGPLLPGEPLLGPLCPLEPLVQQMVPQSLTTLVELLRQPVTVVWGTMVGRGPLEPVNQLPLSQLLPLLPPLSPASLLPPRQIVMQSHCYQWSHWWDHYYQGSHCWDHYVHWSHWCNKWCRSL
jgi:hypothetical protein